MTVQSPDFPNNAAAATDLGLALAMLAEARAAQARSAALLAQACDLLQAVEQQAAPKPVARPVTLFVRLAAEVAAQYGVPVAALRSRSK